MLVKTSKIHTIAMSVITNIQVMFSAYNYANLPAYQFFTS